MNFINKADYRIAPSIPPHVLAPARKGIAFSDLKTQYLALKPEIDRRIQIVLEHGQYILGPEVAELESSLRDMTGAAHCTTVASGTEALLISLMAIGIEPGDEVITTAFSFVATAEAIVLLGAVPVFVDIEPETCNISAAAIEAKVTPRTRAIIPVSLYGQPADMDEINAVAARHGLVVIEDGAQSTGATYTGRRSGNLSTIGCTSFFPSKPLGCYGDGGAIFTADAGLASAMREIRVHGQSRRYVHTRVGVGGRMDTLQCAIVLAKLPLFEWEMSQRRRVARQYAERLESVETIEVRPDRTSVYAQYTVMVENRDEVCAFLNDLGIPVAVHYPAPIPEQPAYARYAAGGACPHAARAARRVLSLPMSAYLDESTLDFITDSLLAALHRCRA